MIDSLTTPMQPAWIIQKTVWSLNLVGSALVIWRLYSIGLHKRYPFFVGSIGLALARSAILFPFAPTSERYYQLWAMTQPLLWVSYILVVSELYSLVLRQYQGIYSLGRWFLLVALALAVVITVLTVVPTIGAPSIKHQLLYYYALIERSFVTSLAIFLVLLLALVAWFPVPMSRNLLTHCLIYSAYFFANNVTALNWHGRGVRATYISNVAKLLVGLVCQLCWVFLLSRRGEDRIASMRLRRSPIKEKHLLGQLENLNATLLRTARK